MGVKQVANVTFRVDLATRKKLQELARSHGQTLAGFCRMAAFDAILSAKVDDLSSGIESLRNEVLALPSRKQMDRMLKILVTEIRQPGGKK